MSAALVNDVINSVEMPRFGTRAQFIAGLKFMHGLMRAAGPLLELAATKSDGLLHDYYRKQLVEERDHASWLAEDLAILGEQAPVVDHAAAATAGAQYYYLNHVGPHALLGYIAALEFRPMPLPLVEALEEKLGRAALRTVRHHAVHDIEHAKDLKRVIDQSPEFATIITYSAFTTAKMLAFYLNDRMNEGGA